jgi:hypothetical protein
MANYLQDPSGVLQGVALANYFEHSSGVLQIFGASRRRLGARATRFAVRRGSGSVLVPFDLLDQINNSTP